MQSFKLPEKRFKAWGPSIRDEVDIDFPIENINKYPPARVGKACDFTQATQDRIRMMQAREQQTGRKNYYFWQNPMVNLVVEDGYALVDNKSEKKKKTNQFRNRPNLQQQARQNIQQGNYQEGILGQQKKPKKDDKLQKGKGKGKKGKGRFNMRSMVPTFRDWSVPVKQDWVVVQEIQLASFAKFNLDSRQVKREDLAWCGKLYTYNKKYNTVSTRNPKVLPVAEHVQFFNPTTSSDEIIEAWMSDDAAIEVIATDHILACLMAAGRSVYSWDILISKSGNKILLDKRDGSAVDFLTVNETAHEPPTYLADDKDSINSPPKLGKEAARINQNFSQLIVDPNGPVTEQDPHPFGDEDDGELSATCYRYRKFTLPGDKKSLNPLKAQDLVMAVRTEVQAQSNNTYIAAKCLNEFVPSSTAAKQLSWKQYLESQKGAILANEVKNNSFKVGRWIAQAILAGCDTFKLGYAVRTRPNDPYSHDLIAVHQHPTMQFAAQISLSENNAFGIIRHVIDMVREEEDGDYILLKDPNKPVIRLYSVPPGAFDAAEEEEEEGASEEEA